MPVALLYLFALCMMLGVFSQYASWPLDAILKTACVIALTLFFIAVFWRGIRRPVV